MQQKQQQQGMEADDDALTKVHVLYWHEGNLRVIDGANDMVVEYVSSIVSAALMYWVSANPAFRLATDTQVDGQILITLAAVQMVPELFVDTYACSLEVTGGLIEHYRSYFGSLRWAVILAKAAATGVLIAFILVAAIK